MSVANGTGSVHDCHVSIATAYQGLRNDIDNFRPFGQRIAFSWTATTPARSSFSKPDRPNIDEYDGDNQQVPRTFDSNYDVGTIKPKTGCEPR